MSKKQMDERRFGASSLNSARRKAQALNNQPAGGICGDRESNGSTSSPTTSSGQSYQSTKRTVQGKDDTIYILVGANLRLIYTHETETWDDLDLFSIQGGGGLVFAVGADISATWLNCDPNGSSMCYSAGTYASGGIITDERTKHAQGATFSAGKTIPLSGTKTNDFTKTFMLRDGYKNYVQWSASNIPSTVDLGSARDATSTRGLNPQQEKIDIDALMELHENIDLLLRRYF